MDKTLFMSVYNSGMSYREISKNYNISEWEIRKLLKTLNLKRRSNVTLYGDKIKDFVDKDYSDIRISKELNISGSMVGYIRKRLKIKTNFIERSYSTKEERIKGYLIRHIRSSAKRRNLEFNLDYTDIILPKYCPLLEVQLDYLNKDLNNPYKPSVDRIDNSKGYIKGNIIIISRLANAMKNEADFNQLKTFSKNINNLIIYCENQGARGNITDIFFNNEELSLDS